MVDKKSAFKIYGSYADQVNVLTDNEAGRLFKALINYRNGEEPRNLNGLEMMAFLFIKQQMDYDVDKYERQCETNRKNGMKGGRPRKNSKPEAETVKAAEQVAKQNEKEPVKTVVSGAAEPGDKTEKSYLLTLKEVG